MLLGLGVRPEVRDVIADPALFRFVPPNLASRRIPGLAVQIAGCTVVEHSPVRRPRPGPIGIDPEAGGILGSTPLRHGPRFSPRSAVDPVTARGRAVVLQPRKAWKLLSSFDH